jgi:hypothetical protein
MWPYIGITGFVCCEEIEFIAKLMPPNCRQTLMAGILVSQRTLKGEPQKRPNRNPSLEQLKNIFPSEKSTSEKSTTTLHLIHYNTKDASSLGDQMVQIYNLPDLFCDGFQLNITWPPKWEIIYFLENTSILPYIVLQVGGRAFGMFESSPKELAKKITEYRGLINAVLLDMSGGLGRPMDAGILRPHIEAISGTFPEVGIAVAGGLSAETLHLAEPIIRDFSDISIDAEGRLRDVEDNLDLEKAKNYLLGALELYAKYGK